MAIARKHPRELTMAEQKPSRNGEQTAQNKGITEVTVQGFKSLACESRIEIRPLTILAGANSSGKSSIMQPLLLMKQTLGASTDPGPLLLNGPNAKFTSTDQFVPWMNQKPGGQELSVEVKIDSDTRYKTVFVFGKSRTPRIRDMTIVDESEQLTLHLVPDQSSESLRDSLLAFNPERKEQLARLFDLSQLSVFRDRCFLNIALGAADIGRSLVIRSPMYDVPVSRELNRMIHIPGLRGARERFFATIASGPPFPGLFEEYVPTAIVDWQTDGDERLSQLEDMLSALRMTSELRALRVNDTQVDLLVGRLSEGARTESDLADLVSIADVGFGVSQVLPVLVAFLVAEKDQLVYVEQPELHLHPRAQYALARIIADTARRGVRLVMETHSALLLLQVRTLMAIGDLDPDLVKLHWFFRKEDGITSIQSTDLDEDGAFGDWPEDFGSVELMAEGAYLDAVEGRSRS